MYRVISWNCEFISSDSLFIYTNSQRIDIYKSTKHPGVFGGTQHVCISGGTPHLGDSVGTTHIRAVLVDLTFSASACHNSDMNTCHDIEDSPLRSLLLAVRRECATLLNTRLSTRLSSTPAYPRNYIQNPLVHMTHQYQHISTWLTSIPYCKYQ